MASDEGKITPEFLDSFNKRKADIEASVNAVKAATEQINALTREAQTAFSPPEVERISKALNAEVSKANTHAGQGKNMLAAMKNQYEGFRAKNSSDERIAPLKTQHVRLCKLYVDIMKEHQVAKENMRKTQTDTLIRRGEIVLSGSGKSTAEIKAAVERDPASFLQEAVMSRASTEAEAAYAEAQSRARDVALLVRSLNEVAAMMNDLAALVQEQGEMLDSIESNVESAQTYIKKGNENLRSAIALQKKTRKCYCCLLCIVIIIVIVLIAGLGSFFGGAFKSS